MGMELYKSARSLSGGILKRLYWLIPSLLSDPFDISERWFGMTYQVPPGTFWLLLSLGIAVAVLLTYHELRGQKAVLEVQLTDKLRIRRIRQELSSFVSTGGGIKAKCLDRNAEAPTKQAEEWADKVTSYLRDNLGNDYADTFNSWDGLTLSLYSNLNGDKITVDRNMEFRLARLNQFLAELRKTD